MVDRSTGAERVSSFGKETLGLLADDEISRLDSSWMARTLMGPTALLLSMSAT